MDFYGRFSVEPQPYGIQSFTVHANMRLALDWTNKVQESVILPTNCANFANFANFCRESESMVR